MPFWKYWFSHATGQKLELAGQYSKDLVKSSLDVIITVDENRDIVEFNPAAEKTFGYSKDEVIGKNVGLLYAYPEDEAKALESYKQNGLFLGEIYNRRKNGEVFLSYLSSTKLIDAGGNFLGHMGISRDITEQKKAEKALRESRESLKQAQEIARLGNWVWDFTKDELFWSDEIYRIFGFQPQEFAPDFESFFGYTHPDDREWVKNSLIKAKVERTPLDITNRIILPCGSCRIVRERAGIITDQTGEPIRMIGTVQDITEQKTAENMLRTAKENAEKATKLKDKFVTLVSHDLRGPIGAMLGYLKLIKDDTVEPVGEGAKLILEAAIESGMKMNELINELLTVSRLKTGAITPQNTFIDVQHLVASVVLEKAYQASEKGININIDISPNSRVYADKVLIQEVLANLIINSIKFCKKGDTIQVFIPENEPSTIVVEDTGSGIDLERQESIFRYEEKTSTLGTAGEAGTGLGLPLCKDILEAMGGKLDIESKPNKGSRFFIRLPYARPLVMMVDDERTERNLFKEYLKKIDIGFVEADNGRTAIELLDSIKPHLIITNANMPVMDGFKFLEFLKSEDSNKSIPVIMITSDTGIETRRKALDMGVDDFLTKNVDSSDFISHVKQFIG